MSKQLSFRIDDDMWRELSEYASKHDMKTAVAVRMLLRHALGQRNLNVAGFKEGFRAGLADFKQKLHHIAIRE